MAEASLPRSPPTYDPTVAAMDGFNQAKLPGADPAGLPGRHPSTQAVMTTAVVTVPQTTSLGETLAQLSTRPEADPNCALVVQDGALVGLVTDRDLVRLIAGRVPLDTPIADGMTTALTVLTADQPLDALEVLGLMRQRQIHHLPVVDDDQRPVGLVTVGSLHQTLSPPHRLKLQSVRSLISQRLVTVSPTDSALAIATRLAEYKVNCAVVMDQGNSPTPIGLVLRQDVVRFQARQQNLAQVPAQTIMRDLQFWLQPSDSLWLAYGEMRQRRLPCLPVIDSQRQLVGVITQTDVINTLDPREMQASAHQLWQVFRQSDAEQAGLWKTHSAELERLIQVRTEQLEEQAQCDRVLTTLTQRIHESLDLPEILSTTVSEVRQLLGADRAVIYQMDASGGGTIVVEAVVAPWSSLLGRTIRDDCFSTQWIEAYRYGRIQALEDVHAAGLSPCHIDLLVALDIRANLVVPIVCDGPGAVGQARRQLWGLLVVNQCAAPRRWRDWEIQLLERLARSVAIAIRQSALYQQLQADLDKRKQLEAHLKCLNDDLEQQVEARTASWRQVTTQLRDEIAHRSEAETALQESEIKFRSLVEQTNDWVWELDQRHQFVYINPRATEILGYSAEAILHCGFADFMAVDEAVRFGTLLSYFTHRQEPFTQIEATCQRADGTAVVLEISGSPIFSAEGAFQGYRGITRDITERKQTERDIRKALTREKELNELKTRFIAMASHEFRTPLTTILASAETLERYRHKFSEEKQLTILKRIQTSVHHVIGLLNDVLTVGKAEAGKLTCQPEALDLRQFCQDLVDEMQVAQMPPATPIEWVATGTHFWVLADEKLLRHTLINLLSNAVKYSPDHTPVRFELDCSGEATVLRVSDQGIGIPAEDQAHLFDAFHRATNVGNISGTGLGLVIAKRAIEAHGGQIGVVSDVGVGTTFTVALPLAAAP